MADLQKNAETTYGQILSGFAANAGQQGIVDQYAQQRGAADQSMISRGLGNTTVKDSVMRGLDYDQAKLLRPQYGAPVQNWGQPGQFGTAGYGAGQRHDPAAAYMAMKQHGLDEQQLMESQRRHAQQMAADQARFGMQANRAAGGGGGPTDAYGYRARPETGIDSSGAPVGLIGSQSGGLDFGLPTMTSPSALAYPPSMKSPYDNGDSKTLDWNEATPNLPGYSSGSGGYYPTTSGYGGSGGDY